VNPDAGNFGFTGHDRQCHPSKQGEVDVNVQGLRFEAGAAIRKGDEFLAVVPDYTASPWDFKSTALGYA
jgi:hypothetical protein